MRRFVYFAAILLALAPAALADSIQFTINSSVVVTGGSPNDNFYGSYTTLPDATGTQSTVKVSAPYMTGTTTFDNVSVFLPVGSIVTSATIQIILPPLPISGTASVGLETGFGTQAFPMPDTGLHIAPTFDPTATISISNLGVSGNPYPAIVNGNEISTGTFDLTFTASGLITGTVATQGYNWAGWVSGDGQAVVPYSVQVDVNYSTVPEPSTLALFGTGLLGAVSAVRRRLMF